LGISTLSYGKAILATSSLAAGSHTITATYSGDNNNNGSSSSAVIQTVQSAKSSPTTTITSNLNPAIMGQVVTFTASVSVFSATGTVTFFDGSSTMGSSILSYGRATFTTSNLAAGSHSITASYSGDANDNSSSSAILMQIVNGKTKTTTGLSSSLNPATYGNMVTFTSVVFPSTATGAVTFYDGATSLGIATISNGVATLSTSSLSAGTHSLTSVYSGDNGNSGSTSLGMVQTVNAVVVQPPTTPILFAALAKSATEVDLSWSASTSGTGVAGYQITRNGLVTANISGNVLSYADGSTSPNTTYIYSVKAYDSAGRFSNASNGVQVTTPAAVLLTSCPAAATNAFAGCYFNNISLSGNPAFAKTDKQISFYWGNGSPDSSLNSNNFSARWQGNFDFTGGTYTFVAVTSDGMRVYIDGNPVLNQWHDQSANAYMFSQSLTQGTHLIVVEYYEHSNGSTASLWWQQN
jgi:hypothetical protein